MPPSPYVTSPTGSERSAATQVLPPSGGVHGAGLERQQHLPQVPLEDGAMLVDEPAVELEPGVHGADVRGGGRRPVLDERLRHDGDVPTVADERQEEVPVLEPAAHVLVVAAARTPGVAADHRGRRAGVAVQEVDRRPSAGPHDRVDHAVRTQPRRCGTCAGVALQDRDRPLEERRREAVVAVQHGHEVGPGSGDPRVPGRADPAVGLTQHPDAGVALEPLDDLDRLVVGRAVVDHDDGLRDAGLAQDRLDRFGDQLALVERGDDHAHAQHAAHAGTSGPTAGPDRSSSALRIRVPGELPPQVEGPQPAGLAGEDVVEALQPRRRRHPAGRRPVPPGASPSSSAAAWRSSWKSSRVGSEVAK